MNLHKVIPVDELWIGEIQAFTIDRRRVLIVRLEDRFVAFEDRCPHQGVPLSKGGVQNFIVTCPAHEWQFDVRTGQGINPEKVCLKEFRTIVQDDLVYVDLPPRDEG